MQKHQPYIPASNASITELSIVSVLMGCILGTIFGLASLYLVLKVGMTVSASIPVAVISVSIFRWLSKALGMRRTTILENNIVQTTGSAGESIAFSIGVTMPALLVLGYNMDIIRTVTVAVLGGLLGILMMIPLRRGLIVKEHGKLAYPEGTACAEVLIAGEKGGTNAKTIFTGFGVGALIKFLSGEGGFAAIKGAFTKPLSFFKGAVFSVEMAPELVGVGYIIGSRIAWITFAGGVLAYLVIIPAIHLFGGALLTPIFPSTKLIAEMSASEIRNAYVLYIGAGAVASAGIISMFKVLPTIVSAFKSGFSDLIGSRSVARSDIERTDRDLPMWFVVAGCLVLLAGLLLVRSMHLNALSALLIIAFGFLFVTVSSRLTGEIGSSSNPISGMTVATLLVTCLIFLFLGKTSGPEKVAALMIAAVVCVASSNGGTTSQDLKTGFLVGATPRSQQIGILFGAGISAVVLAFALQFFNNASTVFAKRDFGDFRVNPQQFSGQEKLFGAEAKYDSQTYNAVFITPEQEVMGPNGHPIVPAGKYLATDEGQIVYLVDPGINGMLTHRDPAPGQTEGDPVTKLDSPKARLMSLIIDGILTQKLPWGLVLLGVFITLVFELCGIPSLAFAVGVYLPISTTAPIAVGGLVHWLIKREAHNRREAQESDSDSSPGVLYSSGLIAGGAIAGTVLAILAGFKGADFLEKNVGHYLGFFSGSDVVFWLTLGVLAFSVYMIGRGKWLKASA